MTATTSSPTVTLAEAKELIRCLAAEESLLLLKPTGLFVLGSCHSGNNPDLVQEMADVIGRPVAAAVGVCRGVRDRLHFGDGVHWTMGGFAEGRAFTLREPRAAPSRPDAPARG